MDCTDNRPPITVLTSATGLGVYIPGLLVRDAIRNIGIRSEVEVLEGFYAHASLQKFLEARDQFRRNFGLALIGHRMARTVDHCLDASRIHDLLNRWQCEGRREFVTWSGYWLPILNRYQRLIAPGSVQVDLCRIDARRSASFEVHAELESGAREIWLWNAERACLDYEIQVTDKPAPSFETRPNRLLFHGGGWGLGEYQSKLAGAAAAGFELDVVIHHRSEQVFHRSGDRCYLIAGDWQPWSRNRSGDHDYPPTIEIDADGNERLLFGDGVHAMHGIARHCKAIVSKPGGCTLIDSLSAQTPLLWLTPYGFAEQSNAEVWETLGFGMAYEHWCSGGFDRGALDHMHHRQRQRGASTRRYPDVSRVQPKTYAS